MCFLVHCGIGCVCVSSLVCREKPQRGSLKKLQAHRKQRSTHCENILYQGEVGKIPPHTYITVECLVSVDKGAETEGRRMLIGGALDGSGGQREDDTRRHISINSLWNVFLGLLLCKTLVWETTQLNFDDFWLINFNTFLTWASLPSIFDHAGRFEVQQFGDPDVIEEQGCKPKGPLRANSGTERIWVQHTVPNKKGKQKPVKSKFCNWTF